MGLKALWCSDGRLDGTGALLRNGLEFPSDGITRDGG